RVVGLRLAGQVPDAMRRAAPAAASIGVLVNTHSNGDHTFGNRLAGGARIVASRRCAEDMVGVGPARLAAMMRGAKEGAVCLTGDYLGRIFGRFDFAGIGQDVLPPDTFDGSLDLQVGEKLVRLVEVGPAHTAGDVIVHVPADRVVYTADILFIGTHPVVWAGPVANWVRALDMVLDLDAEVIVPGHGPIPTRQHVIDLRAYWEHLLRECRSRLAAGQPVAEAALDLVTGPYADWGEAERLIINVQKIYGELSGQPVQPTTPTDWFRTMAEFDRTLRAPPS